MKITFLGAVQEVTGSRYLVEHESIKILVDCGLYQGEPTLARRNREPFPVDPKSITAIVLTHAHVDHTGFIPALVKSGFRGKIYCSKATYALCVLLLEDSAALQELDAKHSPEQEPLPPLYTILDAQNSLTFFQTVEYDTPINLGASLQVTLIRSNHILGSSFVVISDGTQKLTFSGDLGRPQQFIMQAPPAISQTDYLVLESTYGDRLHPEGDTLESLGQTLREAAQKGGTIIIPSFAVERAQVIMYCLYMLKQKKAIPDIPIFLDSPLTIDVTNLFFAFNDEHTLSVAVLKQAFGGVIPTRTVEQSKKINHHEGSSIIIAGSGMANGGRVVHHLQHCISDPKNTVIFVGYQAHGTTGKLLVDGAQEVKLYGSWYKVRAAIKTINTFSAHADYNEILAWLGHFKQAPKKVFLTHGQEQAALSLEKKIEERFGWSVVVPRYLESFTLD